MDERNSIGEEITEQIATKDWFCELHLTAKPKDKLQAEFPDILPDMEDLVYVRQNR